MSNGWRGYIGVFLMATSFLVNFSISYLLRKSVFVVVYLPLSMVLSFNVPYLWDMANGMYNNIDNKQNLKRLYLINIIFIVLSMILIVMLAVMNLRKQITC